jgi:hypothetical protein
MRKIDQNLHTLGHDIVRLAAFYIRDEADAAGIMLMLRPIEALSGR